MLRQLHLERFKSFRDAVLALGPFTLLVGANASGKSNVRDALRFLHGVGRGYALADILGEKYAEGGQLQWSGIRGGTLEAAFQGSSAFAVEVSLTVPAGTGSDGRAGAGPAVPVSPEGPEPPQPPDLPASYRIEVDVGRRDRVPRVAAERLTLEGRFLFDSHPDVDRPSQPDPSRIYVRYRPGGPGRLPAASFPSHQPVLSQIADASKANAPVRASAPVRNAARAVLNALSAMRFLDLDPHAMRRPSLPGQTVLGDRGENLSSVLQSLCQEEDRKQALLQWVQELTPMDARDFEFPADLTGRVLVTLIEEGGRKASANSASDGTLRFLAMIAAMLGPEPARLYFFEELENGIHPARLYLLLQLIEQRVYAESAEQGSSQRSARRPIQVVASTHSPQLLGLVSRRTLEHASLTYRLTGEHETRIRRILDIPEAERLIEEQDAARLHASGWLEDAVALLADAGATT